MFRKVENVKVLVKIKNRRICEIYISIWGEKVPSKIIFMELVLQKKELIFRFGADYTLNPYENNYLEKLNEIIKNNIIPIVESLCFKEAFDLAINIIIEGTRIRAFEMVPHNHNIIINLQHLFLNEIMIIYSFLNPFTFTDAIKLLTSNRIKVHDLISNKYTIDQFPKMISNSNAQDVKNQIIINYKEVA